MYWKEKYKTRTVDQYEGYDTIYNNIPRLDFAELLDHMEAFTEVHKKYRNAHPAIREAECFDAQFPQMMLGIMPNDLFCGRADIFPLGMNAQYINNEWGFVMNFEWFDGKLEDESVSEKDRRRLLALREYWSDKTSSMRYLNEMDPVEKEYLITGGVGFDPNGQPQAASASSRVAGIFLDYEKLLSYGLAGLMRLISDKQAEHPENDPLFYEGMKIQLGTVIKTLKWYAEEAARLAGEEENEFRRDELLEMERICRKLVTEKPESFREAIQLVIIYTIMDGAREWGRMDDYLALYYKEDMEKGQLDEEEAIRLLSGFWRLMIVKEQITDDRVIIGGLGRKHPKEADVLAMVIMETSRRVKDIVPQLTLRMYHGMKPELYEKALECIVA